jgi:uncharacterized protein
MKFTEHRDPTINLIRHYSESEVQINQKTINHSCIVTQHHVIENWPVQSFEQLDEHNISTLLALKPEVLIIGTGNRQFFLPTELIELFSQHGISPDTMSNSAACRTYNILTTEDREVVLALIFG